MRPAASCTGRRQLPPLLPAPRKLPPSHASGLSLLHAPLRTCTSVPSRGSTHLAVAHVIIAGQANRSAVRLDGAKTAGHSAQRVGAGRLRDVHGVEVVLDLVLACGSKDATRAYSSVQGQLAPGPLSASWRQRRLAAARQEPRPVGPRDAMHVVWTPECLVLEVQAAFAAPCKPSLCTNFSAVQLPNKAHQIHPAHKQGADPRPWGRWGAA